MNIHSFHLASPTVSILPRRSMCRRRDSSPLNTSAPGSHAHNKDILLHNHILSTMCASPLSNIKPTLRFSPAVLDNNFFFLFFGHRVHSSFSYCLWLLCPFGLPQAGTALLPPCQFSNIDSSEESRPVSWHECLLSDPVSSWCLTSGGHHVHPLTTDDE